MIHRPLTILGMIDLADDDDADIEETDQIYAAAVEDVDIKLVEEEEGR